MCRIGKVDQDVQDWDDVIMSRVGMEFDPLLFNTELPIELLKLVRILIGQLHGLAIRFESEESSDGPSELSVARIGNSIYTSLSGSIRHYSSLVRLLAKVLSYSHLWIIATETTSVWHFENCVIDRICVLRDMIRTTATWKTPYSLFIWNTILASSEKLCEAHTRMFVHNQIAPGTRNTRNLLGQ